MFHGRGDALEITHGAQTDIEVEALAHGHVERADATADRRGERSFDADVVVGEGLEGFFRQIGAEGVVGTLSGLHFHPTDVFLSAVSLSHGFVNDLLHGRRDFPADTVARDEGNGHRVGRKGPAGRGG